MKILFTAFYGKTNTSNILINNISDEVGDKIALKNSYKLSVKKLKELIDTEKYDLIVSFGQRPIRKDYIFLEQSASLDGNVLFTDFSYDELSSVLKDNGYNVKLSTDCGKLLCNNLYYEGLKYIKETNRDIKMIFIHIPKLKRISSIDNLTKAISDFFN